LIDALLRIGNLFLDAYTQSESFQLRIATYPTHLTILKTLIRGPRDKTLFLYFSLRHAQINSFRSEHIVPVIALDE